MLWINQKMFLEAIKIRKYKEDDNNILSKDSLLFNSSSFTKDSNSLGSDLSLNN